VLAGLAVLALPGRRRAAPATLPADAATLHGLPAVVE
jgi:hypothetical protein